MAEHDLVGTLLPRGGWDLDDAQARHRENPTTFWLPPDSDLSRLAPGAMVRLPFRAVDQADFVRDGVQAYQASGAPNLVVVHERMWLWVERVEGDELVGILQNVPFASHTRLVPGARVRFRRTDVIDLALAPKTSMTDEVAAMAQMGFPLLDEAACLRPEDATRAPSIAPSQAAACKRAGARPERPWPFALALVGDGVKPGKFPIYGGRFRPRREKRDCGWMIYSVGPQPDAKKEGFQRIHVQDVGQRHREAWAHLALPPGWGLRPRARRIRGRLPGRGLARVATTARPPPRPLRRARRARRAAGAGRAPARTCGP